MNSRIAYIAFNTFREAVRDRVLYNLIAFALLISGAAILVGEISIDIERLVVVNLGLTSVPPPPPATTRPTTIPPTRSRR